MIRRSAALALVVILAAGRLAAQGPVWGSSPTDVWAFTSLGAFRYDGRAWSAQQLPDSLSVTVAHGSSADNLWVAGARSGAEGPAIFRWNGTAWTSVAAPTTKLLAAIAVTRTAAYVLEENDGSGDTLVGHAWNGTAWTTHRLPHLMIVAGMHVVGNELWLGGFAYVDPTPGERKQFGTVLRLVNGRWVSTFTGRVSSDPVIGRASWNVFAVSGETALLAGLDSTGVTRVMVRRAGGWEPVPRPNPVPQDGELTFGFLLGDGTPVLRYETYADPVMLRYAEGSWQPFAVGAGPALPPRYQLNPGWRSWSPPGAALAYSTTHDDMIVRLDGNLRQLVVNPWCTSGRRLISAHQQLCMGAGGAAGAPAGAAPPLPAPSAPRKGAPAAAPAPAPAAPLPAPGPKRRP